MKNDKTILRFESSSGLVVYKLPVEAFPKHVTNCYLVLDDAVTLIDAASGLETSNEELEAVFEKVGAEFGEKVRLPDVGRLILTHGHIDHFGGLNFVVEKADPQVCIHALDASVLKNFDERLILASHNLHVFLQRAGLTPDKIETLRTMHKWSKGMFHASKVDLEFEEGAIPGSPFYAWHSPGHCPGQVCLQLDEILFTADHVLSYTTPTQSPEFIYRYTGLGHYFEALRKVRDIDDVRLGLGGHEAEIHDVPARVDDIIGFHEKRLEKTRNICDEPKSIQQISLELFGERKEYHVLLALLETGAHVEYLYERGQLVVSNIQEVEDEPNPVLLYSQA
jgi:glyoxylase-like metal-dependent hydrolase (beta-lactamase superfamily II)